MELPDEGSHSVETDSDCSGCEMASLPDLNGVISSELPENDYGGVLSQSDDQRKHHCPATTGTVSSGDTQQHRAMVSSYDASDQRQHIGEVKAANVASKVAIF